MRACSESSTRTPVTSGAVVSSLPYYATQGIGEALVNAYDIVALDPRGVGDSTPVFCTTDAERDAERRADDRADREDQPPVALGEVDDLVHGSTVPREGRGH